MLDRVISAALAGGVGASTMIATPSEWRLLMPPRGESPGGTLAPSLRAHLTADRRQLDAVIERIAEFGRLPDGFTSYGCEKPSAVAVQCATILVEDAERSGYLPTHVTPMADGGIALRFVEGDRTVRFDVYNDGGIALISKGSSEEEPTYSDVEVQAAARAAVRFLRPG